ncbi:MAG: hypothetical protein ABI574_08315 [Burkholderiales bacterium]
MTPRQRDQFLWTWSRRRAPGPGRAARRGACIGAVCGVVIYGAMFDVIMAPVAGRTGLSTLLNLFDDSSLALLMLVPGLAAVGWLKARSVFNWQEAMFQRLLSQGATVPTAPPTLQFADRLPLLAVIATGVILAGLILGLVWAYTTGRL